MLREILESTGLSPKTCADLVGLDHELFHTWLVGQRPIPSYIVPELSSILGVSREAILSSRPSRAGSDNAPAIWFKFRSGDKLTDADREIVLVIRKLAHFMDELESLTERRLVSWKALFETVRSEVNKQAPPREQGRLAARVVRAYRDFGFPVRTRQGIKGAGDMVRENLRAMGVRVVETPVPSSNLEGCSFYVGAPGSERPCLFANSFKQTWFRRNMVLMHELAHAIFDIEGAAASLDFVGEDDVRQLEEVRAQAFAQEALVPREVLNHIAQTNGLKWHALSSTEIALLVASSQVEQRAMLKAAYESGFLTTELAEQYLKVDIHEDLKRLTERALTTQEFIEAKHLQGVEMISAQDRTTTIPSRALRLPLTYVVRIVELAKENDISRGKAAQMLMIDNETFKQRFGSALPEVTA